MRLIAGVGCAGGCTLSEPVLPVFSKTICGRFLETITRGVTHPFYTNRAQINGGANDRFALLSDAGGFSMGYYSRGAMEQTELWKAAPSAVRS